MIKNNKFDVDSGACPGGAVSSRTNTVLVRLSGFTLIELLVVMTIMAMLMVAAIPAFRNMTAQGLQSAVPDVMATLRLARQWAVGHREYTYVIFPDQTMNYTGQDVTMALRSYAVVSGKTATTATNYISEWKYLPAGIYFDDVYSLSANNIFENYTAPPGAYPDYHFPFPAGSDTRQTVPAIQFRPNGEGYWWKNNRFSRGDEFHIVLSQGILDVNPVAGTIPPPGQLIIPSNRTNRVIRVWGLTGQVDIRH
jgi:prepilin-type N-terminal cleavage/methylation domain-containing protein